MRIPTVLALALVAACSGNGGKGPAGTGSTAAATCADVRAKVEQLYRADAQAKEPQRVDEAVADNTAMVMGDCAKQPAKIAPCVGTATTVEAMEKCLGPLDDEGTEGEALRK
ncbi:MAG: hypothetical protein KIT31_18540 [Deltaproteobacteria bacterium]|nr:hypothetical protein [Deltaproteobacteria bacterium]